MIPTKPFQGTSGHSFVKESVNEHFAKIAFFGQNGRAEDCGLRNLDRINRINRITGIWMVGLLENADPCVADCSGM